MLRHIKGLRLALVNSVKYKMKGFIPTAESHGFPPCILRSGLRSGLPAIALAQARRAGCCATKSPFAKRIGETKCCHGSFDLEALDRLARGAPPASQIKIGLRFSPSSRGFDEVKGGGRS